MIGIDHRHIFGQLDTMQLLGCTCKGWWTQGAPEPLKGFTKRFPNIPRVANRQELLDDPEIDMILIADVPVRRADRAIDAMRAGKDVMTVYFQQGIPHSWQVSTIQLHPSSRPIQNIHPAGLYTISIQKIYATP